MKKLSLLLGTIGGAVAGYVFSNKKLRAELSDAKDAKDAGKILAKHLKEDGTSIGAEVQKFVQSDEVQKSLNEAKKYVTAQAGKLQKELKGLVAKKGKGAKGAAKKGKK